MAGNGGARPGAGRKPNAVKLFEAQFAAPFFGPERQATIWNRLLKSEDDKIVIDATKYLTDRIYGKARQSVEVTGEDGEAIQHAVTVTFVRTNGNPEHKG